MSKEDLSIRLLSLIRHFYHLFGWCDSVCHVQKVLFKRYKTSV
jgi:hypothetical protein